MAEGRQVYIDLSADNIDLFGEEYNGAVSGERLAVGGWRSAVSIQDSAVSNRKSRLPFTAHRLSLTVYRSPLIAHRSPFFVPVYQCRWRGLIFCPSSLVLHLSSFPCPVSQRGSGLSQRLWDREAVDSEWLTALSQLNLQKNRKVRHTVPQNSCKRPGFNRLRFGYRSRF